MRFPNVLAMVLLVVGTLICVGCTVPPDPYTPTDYENWRTGMETFVKGYVTDSEVKFVGSDMYTAVDVFIKGATKRQAGEIGKLTAMSYLKTFPEQSSCSVSVKDYDSLDTLSYDIYSLK